MDLTASVSPANPPTALQTRALRGAFCHCPEGSSVGRSSTLAGTKPLSVFPQLSLPAPFRHCLAGWDPRHVWHRWTICLRQTSLHSPLLKAKQMGRPCRSVRKRPLLSRFGPFPLMSAFAPSPWFSLSRSTWRFSRSLCDAFFAFFLALTVSSVKSVKEPVPPGCSFFFPPAVLKRIAGSRTLRSQ